MSDENTADLMPLKKREELLFNVIAGIASLGGRSPTNDELRQQKLTAALLPTIARKGYIQIILYQGNRRQIKILHGDHAGACTKKPADNLPIVRTIDKDSASLSPHRTPAALDLPQW